MKITPLPNKVLVSDMQRGQRQIGSIILPDDNGKLSGIRPRWAQVYDVGSDVIDIKAGDWILIKHGRWTRSHNVKDDNGETILMLWGVEYPEGIMAVSDTEPEFETFSDDVSIDSINREIVRPGERFGVDEY
jgi:co-chaperonin GroES (HSP10)